MPLKGWTGWDLILDIISVAINLPKEHGNMRLVSFSKRKKVCLLTNGKGLSQEIWSGDNQVVMTEIYFMLTRINKITIYLWNFFWLPCCKSGTILKLRLLDHIYTPGGIMLSKLIVHKKGLLRKGEASVDKISCCLVEQYLQ